MLDVIKPGKHISDVFTLGCDSYTRNGLQNEWKNHHQGGLTGYMAREIRADHTTMQPITTHQANAFSPSMQGAKCEDTVLTTENGLIFLAAPSVEWPCVQLSSYRRPGIIRSSAGVFKSATTHCENIV